MGKVSMSISHISIEDRIKALEAENESLKQSVNNSDYKLLHESAELEECKKEIESLKAQLEAKSKAPSHWDTAPEGAVQLVNCSGGQYYLNDHGEYWNENIKTWILDTNPEGNILIDERTL